MSAHEWMVQETVTIAEFGKPMARLLNNVEWNGEQREVADVHVTRRGVQIELYSATERFGF